MKPTLAASGAAIPLQFDTLWRTELGSSARGPASLLETSSGPRIILGTESGEVVALDGTGKRVWTDTVDARPHGWPTVVELPSGPAVLIGDSDGTLHAYDPEGSSLWKTSLGDLRKTDWGHSGISPWSGPAPVRGGGDVAIAVTDRGGRLSGMTADGRIVWQMHLSERTHFNLVGNPAVGDLDCDGADEIVVTSFDGRALCFGADGSLRWARNAYHAEAGYHSPLIADFGEGPRVFMLGENPAELCCLDGYGEEVWQHETRNAVALQMNVTPYRDRDQERLFVGFTKTGQEILDTNGAVLASHAYSGGEGLFFGPTAADLDGDGSVELLMVRFHYGTLLVLDAMGNERGAIDIEGETTSAPLIADIDNDGVPEFVLVESGSGTVRAYRAHDAVPGGEIHWPTSRGPFDGTRRYKSVNASGPVRREPAPRDDGAIAISRNEPAHLTATRESLRFGVDGATPDSWIWSEIRTPDDARHLFVNRIADPDHGWVEPLASGDVSIVARVHDVNGAVLGESSEALAYTLFERERATGEELVENLAALSGRAALSSQQIASLRATAEVLGIRMDRTATGTREARRELGAELAEWHAELKAELARRGYANAADVNAPAAELAVWPNEHPWVAFDPRTDQPADNASRTLEVVTERNSHEASSVSVANLTTKTINARIWLAPWDGDGPVPEPSAATLRRRVFVATARGGWTPDALPELDASGVVTIPAGESVRVWIDWDSGETPPGDYSTKLCVRALTVPGEVVELPVSWRILPLELPAESPLAFHVWAYERPEFFNRDAVWKDLVDHRVTVYDPPTAEVLYDTEGHIVSEDWSGTDEYLARVPKGAWLFWKSRDNIVKPAEGAPDIGSDAWQRAFNAFVPRWIDGLAERGYPLDRHMNYFLDEPGIHGGGDVDEFVRIANLYKAADPRTPIFCNPAGGTSHEHLERLAEVTDVFAPIWQWPNEYMHLPRILELGKRTWTYQCGDGAKDNVRMRYYWSPFWRGAQVGLTGAGIWSYAGRGIDFWQGPHDGCCDWELVYHGFGGSVVPSHRWQGVRIGIEDYIRLHMLAERSSEARESGDTGRAEKLARVRSDAMQQVIDSDFDEAVVARVRAELRAALMDDSAQK